MSDMIEYEVLIDNLVNYMPMENEKIIVTEYTVDVRSFVANKKTGEIKWPQDTVIAYVIRDEKIINACSVEEFLVADRVVVLSTKENFETVKKLFYWR